MKDNESLDAATVITQIWEKSGAGGFFAGLGSRCVWAGAIIAGQFLLYEVFKGVFQVCHCTHSRVVVPMLYVEQKMSRSATPMRCETRTIECEARDPDVLITGLCRSLATI